MIESLKILGMQVLSRSVWQQEAQKLFRPYGGGFLCALNSFAFTKIAHILEANISSQSELLYASMPLNGKHPYAGTLLCEL